MAGLGLIVAAAEVSATWMVSKTTTPAPLETTMWHGMRISLNADADFVTSAIEMLRSASRHLILVVSGVCVALYFVSVVALPDAVNLKLFPLTALIVLVCACSLWLLARSTLVAQAVWQVGLATVITLTAHMLHRPEAAFFCVSLPLFAAVSIGWPGALVSSGLVTFLVCWLTPGPAKLALPVGYAVAISAVAAVAGLIGWVMTRSLLTVTQWSLFSYERAQRRLEEARDQRLELKQVQADLILATSELARLSDRLKVMHQIAEEARQAKERFVANVSHELRTPLNMIISFSEMITESPRLYGTALPPALLADIEIIQRNSQHLSRLVNDVLDLSQVEAGRLSLSKEWCSLRDILEEAILAVRPLFDSRGLYLEMEAPPDLPQVYCDSTRVRQVVLNLLSNAGRFTEKGGVTIRVQQRGESLIVSVADTGPGIAPEDRKSLFEPFRQLDITTHRAHEGSGLGLSISKQLVELHGGSLWLESTVGVGTTFYFSLPLAPSPSGLAEDDIRRWFSPYHQYEERRRRSKAPPPIVAPRFIVLEEGNALSRMLGRYADGAEIVSVRSTQEATDILVRSPATALIVNAGSYVEMANRPQRLPDLPYDTPVVTCWVPTETEAARRLGVVRYLTKPVSRETLLATLAALGSECKSVLVVDDEPEMLQLISRLLSAAEYQPLQAGNGQRALSLLRQRRPDVMLLDLIMPEMDGFQVLQEKSQDPTIRDIPVVVISARNPAGEPLVSEALAVTRSGGLSVREILACALAFSDILSPLPGSDDRGWRENPAD